MDKLATNILGLGLDDPQRSMQNPGKDVLALVARPVWCCLAVFAGGCHSIRSVPPIEAFEVLPRLFYTVLATMPKILIIFEFSINMPLV